MNQSNNTFGGLYALGALLVGGAVFIVSWLYCIAAYGFLIGVVFGWIPAAIVGTIAGYLWPLVLIGGFYLYSLIFPSRPNIDTTSQNFVNTAPATVPTQSTPSAQSYPEAPPTNTISWSTNFKNGWVQSCVNGGGSQSLCQCEMEYFQARYSPDAYTQLTYQYQGNNNPPPLVNAVNYCNSNPNYTIDCTGPDGKHLRVTQKECDDFNSAWHNNKPNTNTGQTAP